MSHPWLDSMQAPSCHEVPNLILITTTDDTTSLNPCERFDPGIQELSSRRRAKMYKSVTNHEKHCSTLPPQSAHPLCFIERIECIHKRAVRYSEPVRIQRQSRMSCPSCRRVYRLIQHDLVIRDIYQNPGKTPGRGCHGAKLDSSAFQNGGCSRPSSHTDSGLDSSVSSCHRDLFAPRFPEDIISSSPPTHHVENNIELDLP